MEENARLEGMGMPIVLEFVVGERGIKGEKGEKGDPGRDGIDGKDGKDGTLIYPSMELDALTGELVISGEDLEDNFGFDARSGELIFKV